MRLFDECCHKSACHCCLNEFQFLITHIQATFLPPAVHFRDCDGHHNFLGFLMPVQATPHEQRKHVYMSSAPCAIPKPASIYRRGDDCRVKIHLANPSFCRTVCLRHTLESQTDWNGSYVSAALCSMLSCVLHWKWLQQKPGKKEI